MCFIKIKLYNIICFFKYKSKAKFNDKNLWFINKILNKNEQKKKKKKKKKKQQKKHTIFSHYK
jgi:hypothetical protein